MTDNYHIIEDDHWNYPLGVTRTKEGIHVSVAAKGDTCELALYREGQGEPAARLRFPEGSRVGDVWSMTVAGEDFSGMKYCFESEGRVFADPYGRAFAGHESWGDLDHVKKPFFSLIVDEKYDWEGDVPLSIPLNDTVLYRLHPRGFTKHSSSRVKDKGTFKAVEEKIPYLKGLGITTVEMMMPMEFDEVIVPGSVDGNPRGKEEPTGKINYWGYAPACYFAPKASYCSGKMKQPVTEFKSLVKALHKNGLELVVEMYFPGDEEPSLLVDAVRFWVQEYHVDGVHIAGRAPTWLLEKDPYLSGVKLLADGWQGLCPGARRHLAEYNDGFLADMRRFLKGDEDQLNSLVFRSKRNPPEFGVINYLANTNGFTMMDMVSYDRKHNELNGENNQDGADYNYSWNCGVEGATKRKKVADLRRKQLRNAFLLLFLSQGTPLLLAGDEFGNSQGGNNNAYCQDNETSWLNWNQLQANRDLYDFVKYVIAFRKRHPVFHMEQEPRLMDYLACGQPDVSYHGVRAWCPEFENFRRQLGIMYSGEYARRQDGSADDYFYVALNMHWEPHEFALPNLPKKLKWHLAFNTDDTLKNGFYEAGEEPLLQQQKQFEVPPRTIVVLIGKTVPEEKKRRRP